MKRIISLLLSTLLTINVFATVSFSQATSVQAASYRQQLIDSGFPESYVDALVDLHTKYPKWSFEPLKTGLEWSDVIKGERSPHNKQLIEKLSSYSTSMFCNCSSCYKNGNYVIQEASNWVSASQIAVEYYMDPRNWLDEKHIFQFESTAYSSTQTLAGVEAILDGTWMHNAAISYKDKNGKTLVIEGNKKYSTAIMEAAKDSGMSAYYLASKIKQEVGGTKPTAGGASGENSTYPGIYNYYNIGAFTGYLDGLKWAASSDVGYTTNCSCRVRKSPTTASDELVTLPKGTSLTYKSITEKQSDGYKWYYISVTYGGKSYTGYIRSDLVDKKSTDAYDRPWTDPYKSIYNGAKWIAGNFKTQTSGYLQKFNVNPKSSNLYQNEYMANVAAASTEAEKTYYAYQNTGKLSDEKTFNIPVFNNMVTAPRATTITSLDGIKKGFIVRWSKVDETTGYQIQYATKSDFSNAAEVYGGGTSTTSKTITGRAADTIYYVRVRTYKNVNNNYIWGEWTPAQEVMTFSVDAPDATEFTSVSAVTNGFKLSWRKVDETKGYQIQYATKSDFSNAATIYGGATSTTSKTITGRAEGTKYYVRIRTYKNINGYYLYGEWSASKSVTTLTNKPPKATELVSVTGISKGFEVKWNKVSETTGYQIQYATRSDFSNAATVYGGSTNVTSKEITGRAENTNYYVRVRTYKNINGNYLWGEWSGAKSVKTLNANTPRATTITAVNALSKGFEVKWNKVDETKGYQIQYATRSDFSNAATIYAGPTATTSKAVTGRAANTKYYVRVRTYKNVNSTYYYGEWSPSKSVTTLK